MNNRPGVSLVFGICLLTGTITNAQEKWPRTVTAADGMPIRIYQPQADSFTDNTIWFRAAFSLTEKGGREPGFGFFRAKAIVQTDRSDRMISFQKLKVLSLRLPNKSKADGKGADAINAGKTFQNNTDQEKADTLREILEREIPRSGMTASLDEFIGALCMNPDQFKLYVYGELNYIPPRILVASKPSILVTIDGVPLLKWYTEWGVKVVVNTPFTIAESTDGWYYLYGGKNWYIAPEAIGPYYPISYMPSDMRKVQAAIDQANGAYPDTSREGSLKASDVILSTEPAELIQTKGTPVFSPVQGTSLSYVSNSNNDIFLDTAQQRYYILLSGRWFSAATLAGTWKFVAPDSLPADFARIPEGSVKGNVLVSVAGTDAALEAVIDARIPQTALVDRKTIPDTLIYDGVPEFSKIRGTNMQYAVNTAAIVLRHRGNYYYVDRGIWFCGNSPSGPWEICLQRPDEVGKIPPDYPVYPCKFVYTYGAGQDSVYAGFSAGYLNAYTDGPTIVYGTGYYYPGWRKNEYYPKPATWGFNMSYSSWMGWSLGNAYSLDWLNTGAAWGQGFWNGGWWGPPVYRPPYAGRSSGNHGVNYNNRVASSAELICTDIAGTVYRRGKEGAWQKYDDNQWKKIDSQNPEDKQVIMSLDRQEVFRDRARVRMLVNQKR